MFQAPPRITAKLYARLPDSLHGTTSSYWSRVQSGNPAIRSFLEGPSFDRDGNLWVTDIPFGRLFRVGPDREFELVFQYDGEPNGLKVHADGRAFIADHSKGLLVFDPPSKSLDVMLGRAELDGFRGLNDLFFLEDGTLFFTDQGQTGLQDPAGRLFYCGPSGIPQVVLSNVPSPNGLVHDPASNTVYLAVTRDNAIWRVPLRPSGQAGRTGRFIRLSGGIGPDGMALDQDGNLAVCHPGLGVVWLFDRYGEPVLRIDSPAGRMTTNCAFGGPEGRTLFITESETGSILAAECPAPGVTLFSHREHHAS
jgi:gluconolactonase